jgi:hypothetical protein
MEGSTIGSLGNLLPATESVGDNHILYGRPSHGGQNGQFSNPLRHLILLLFEAEGPSHPATTGIKYLHLPGGLSENFALRPKTHHRFMVTMSVDNGFSV